MSDLFTTLIAERVSYINHNPVAIGPANSGNGTIRAMWVEEGNAFYLIERDADHNLVTIDENNYIVSVLTHK